jgi:hypothetical protein
MKNLIKAIDSLPTLLKIILALPALDIVWNVYRVARSLANDNLIGAVLGAVLIVVGIPFMWLVDILTLLFTGDVLWID